jgi:lipopolysaccharide transport system permease protein
MGCEWLTTNSSLLKKIYFPRLVVPLSGILTNLAFWAVAFLVYAALYYPLGGRPSLAILGYLVILPSYVAFTFGVGLIFSVVHALFRDLRHIVDVLLPLLFWLTPILWAPSALPPGILPLLSLNPLYPFFHSFAAMFCDGVWPDPRTMVLCAALGTGALGTGLLVFTRQVSKVVERL